MTATQTTAATVKEIAAKMEEYHMEAGEESIAAEYVMDDKRRVLRAEFERLAAFDTTEFKEHVNSAEVNAADTCREEGLSDFDGLRYWEMAVATLDMILDANGTATPRTVEAALEAVKVADAAFVAARRSLASALVALNPFTPHKPGDILTHERYGKVLVSSMRARSHGQHYAVWEITACPFLKSGKSGVREVSWVLKITR